MRNLVNLLYLKENMLFNDERKRGQGRFEVNHKPIIINLYIGMAKMWFL